MVQPGQNGNMAQLQRMSFDPSTQQLTSLSNGLMMSPTSAGIVNGHASSSSTDLHTSGHHMTIANPTTPPSATAVNSAATGHATASTGENSQASEEVEEEEEEEEPLYVNAKQYNRILKRRLARAKLESEGRIPKIRQVHYFTLFCFKGLLTLKDPSLKGFSNDFWWIDFIRIFFHFIER